MAGRAKYWLVMLAALPLAITAARAQSSEYDALPKPAAAAPASPSPAPAVSEKPAPSEPKQKSAGEKAHGKEKTASAPAEKDPAAQKKGAALKEKDDDAPIVARRMAPSASIPAWPGDEKGPKTLEFLGACPNNFDRCMEQVREIGEKMSATELCIPTELYFATVTDRVRKWATLRPDIHGQPAGRVIAAALRSIYPCKHGTPARTAAEKDAKGAKAAQ